MNTVTRIIVAGVALIGITFASGCKSDCEKAYDNSISIFEGEKDFPKKALEKMKSDEEKKKFLDEECKKMGEEAVKCAVDAKDAEALMKCSEKKKKD